MNTTTHYDVLGVPTNADNDTIKKAFRRIARDFHPDRAGDSASARESFNRARIAHDVLTDNEKRKAYDQSISVPKSVGDLLLRNQRGNRVITPLLPTAVAEPKNGIHLVQIIPGSGSTKWKREESAGEPGKNAGVSGDLFLVEIP